MLKVLQLITILMLFSFVGSLESIKFWNAFNEAVTIDTKTCKRWQTWWTPWALWSGRYKVSWLSTPSTCIVNVGYEIENPNWDWFLGYRCKLSRDTKEYVIKISELNDKSLCTKRNQLIDPYRLMFITIVFLFEHRLLFWIWFILILSLFVWNRIKKRKK